MDDATNNSNGKTRGLPTLAQILGLPTLRKKAEKPRRARARRLTEVEYVAREAAAQKLKESRELRARVRPGFVIGLGAAHSPVDQSTLRRPVRG